MCRRCIRRASRRRRTAWTLDAMLEAAEACHKGGNPFGIGLGQTEDNVDTSGAIFQSFGAELVDAKGNIKVKTDAVRQALEYYKKLAQWLPPDAPAWDNASNNKYLISGKGALIMNPPSAWAVAKRDAPAGRRAVLDARHAVRAEGPLRAVPAVLLGHLGVRQEQAGGQGPAAAPVAAGGGREDGDRRARATTCRRSRSSPRSRSGPRRGRRRARSITIRTRTITRSCRSAARRRRPRSPIRFTPRRSRPRWWCAT